MLNIPQTTDSFYNTSSGGSTATSSISTTNGTTPLPFASNGHSSVPLLPSFPTASFGHYQAYAPSSNSTFSRPPALPSPPLLVPAPLLPYQTTQTVEQIESEKLARMIVQTKELDTWMKAREIVHGGGTISQRGKERRYSLDGDARSPKRARASLPGREDRVDDIQIDTMRLMREAEERAGSVPRRSNGTTKKVVTSAAILEGTTWQHPSFHHHPSAPQYQPPPPLPLYNYITSSSSHHTLLSHVPLSIPPRVLAPSPPARPLSPRSTSHPRLPPLPPLPPPPVTSASKRNPTPSRPRPRVVAPVSVSPATTPTTKAKPTLLSTAQKKANHIASEQKRRAAIRTGYERLCDAVPALKAAVAEDEARSARGGRGSKSSSSTTTATTRGKGKATATKKDKVGQNGEKVDGRAGPKSEAIVLAKCALPFCLSFLFATFRRLTSILAFISAVAYLRALLQSRASLLQSLASNEAREQSMGRTVAPSERLWDEKWTRSLSEEFDSDRSTHDDEEEEEEEDGEEYEDD